jgi:catechol 2,3-dioxygenase-like lactoylglutathione lyase family enzyme
VDATSLAPFVPGGPDFGKSRDLFRELGFEETWSSDGYVGFRSGGATFILQDLDEPAFAANLMIRVDVPDLDASWATVSAKELPALFPGVRLKPPTAFPWGREVHFIDLAGVCWHVGAD